jgi:hypothetical protein
VRTLCLGHPPDARRCASDGDLVFQIRKTQRCGLWEAVDGRVLIYLHQEQMLKKLKAAIQRAANLVDCD